MGAMLLAVIFAAVGAGVYWRAPFEACAFIRIDKALFDRVFFSADWHYWREDAMAPTQQVIHPVIDELRKNYRLPEGQRQAYFYLMKRLSIRQIAPQNLDEGPTYVCSVRCRDDNPDFSIAAVNAIAESYLAMVRESTMKAKVEPSRIGFFSPADNAEKFATPASIALSSSGLCWFLYLILLIQPNRSTPEPPPAG